jgi:Restriction endonuclease
VRLPTSHSGWYDASSMSYDLKNLSSVDFEDLTRDLIGSELGCRFEAFSSGPDQGMDGRHARGQKKIILQAKHYVDSSFSTLKRRMVKERQAIEKIKSSRYVLATSRPLTPKNKASLAEILEPFLKRQSDIFGPDDLRGLLRKYPEVAKTHIKLWLGSTEVLEHVFRHASKTFAAITLDEIRDKVRIYAHNPSYPQSFAKLEANHIVIISGPPGVGKTTLADMLSYAYVGEGWDLIAIRSLDDGFASINDKAKQIFLFDDFLGKVALDKYALSSKDSDLVRFMGRVRKSKNARFILTTRAYILEEARRVSEHLADRRLDVSEYVLDVGIYTRRIRARILFNHLAISNLPKAHIRALIRSSALLKIVDHKHYNPRVIEWMTDTVHVDDIKASQYPKAFLAGLDSPRRLWDTAFRTHIDDRCRHLLIALFFCSEYGANILDLQRSFEALHDALCARYGVSRGPKDFEEGLRILEGGFIGISGQTVSFINPSFRDYMAGYLADEPLLLACAPTAQTSAWARSLWQYARQQQVHPSTQQQLATAFAAPSKMFGSPGRASSNLNMPSSEHLALLLEWWTACQDKRLADVAIQIAANRSTPFSIWRDGEDLVKLATELRDGEAYVSAPWAETLAVLLEERLLDLLRGWVPVDDLEKISDAVDVAGQSISDDVRNSVIEVIRQEFEELSDRIESTDSESSLTDHMASLRRLAPRGGVPEAAILAADRTIKRKLASLYEETSEAEAPDVGSSQIEDAFNDRALRDLFAPLLTK